MIIAMKAGAAPEEIRGVIARIREMGPRDRRSLVREIAQEGLLSEDMEDVVVSESRKGEPSMPAQEFFEHMASKAAKRS